MTRGTVGTELSLLDLLVLLFAAFCVWSDQRQGEDVSSIGLGAPRLVPLSTTDVASAAHLLSQSVVALLAAESSEHPT
jgi:hypothetical protein